MTDTVIKKIIYRERAKASLLMQLELDDVCSIEQENKYVIEALLENKKGRNAL